MSEDDLERQKAAWLSCRIMFAIVKDSWDLEPGELSDWVFEREVTGFWGPNDFHDYEQLAVYKERQK